MRRLKKLLKTIDNYLFPTSFIIFIFLIPLYPKIPLIPVNFTYVAIRLEDIYFVFLSLLFGFYFIRRKYKVDKNMLKWFIFFWVAIFISYAAGVILLKTIEFPKVGFLHTLRRVEYMLPFFYAAALIKRREDLLRYLKIFLFVLALVNLYALGQRYLNFPAIQTMNPEYAKGRLLFLTPEARVSSTFAGHYDLAAYLVLFIPLTIAMHLYTGKKRYLLLLALSIYILILTVSRISFIAYVFSVILLLLYLRKFKYLLLVILLTFLLSFGNKTLFERFARTFQVKKVFINEQTGQVYIPQKIRPDELPAGSFFIKVQQNELLEKLAKEQTSEKELIEAEKRALRDIALQAGLSTSEAELIAATRDYEKLEEQIKENKSLQDQLKKIKPLVSKKTIAKNREVAQQYLKPVTTILSDISFATRLQIEWPRAIAAFLSSPIVGFGAGSLTEATDNDYLRWLGEFGLLGTLIFLYILIKKILVNFIKTQRLLMRKKNNLHLIFAGVSAGIIGLLLNATYIDVFEASKVAFTFWMISGIFYPVSQKILARYAKKPKK